MAGPYLWLRVELRPAVKGAFFAIIVHFKVQTGPPLRDHEGLLSPGLGVAWFPQELACGWTGHLPYWQGFRVRTEQGMGCV